MVEEPTASVAAEEPEAEEVVREVAYAYAPPDKFEWYDKFVLPVIVPMFLIWWNRWVERRYARREAVPDAG